MLWSISCFLWMLQVSLIVTPSELYLFNRQPVPFPLCFLLCCSCSLPPSLLDNLTWRETDQERERKTDHSMLENSRIKNSKRERDRKRERIRLVLLITIFFGIHKAEYKSVAKQVGPLNCDFPHITPHQ